MKKLLQKPIILLIVLALGIGLTVMMVKNKPPVQHNNTQMKPRTVEVIPVESLPFRARVSAYGNVEPAISLQSKAELNGKITYLHPELKQGGSIAAGTVVVRIEADDFLVSLKQSEADLQSSESALKQIQEEQRTTARSLKLAQENLRVGEKELARVQDIWNKRLIARSTLDAEEQKVIQLRQSVSDLQGQMNTYASRIAAEKAKITRAEEQVKGQQTTLGRTEITMPFDARIGDVPVEQGEFVTAGALLFEALNLDGVEINAQVPVRQMRGLVAPLGTREVNLDVTNLSNVLKAMQLQAEVTLVGDPQQARWQAEVQRLSESIDPQRRTLGIVVAVDKPYEKVIPGVRPPLIKGMFTQVEIYTPPRDALVIPYKALHQGRVYLVDAEGNLEIRPVEVALLQGELAVIKHGLSGGEQLIVNDLIPVIPGMPLTAQVDEELQQDLREQAAGARLQASPAEGAVAQ
ncbi:efflux RND transporter periplasmic adaptor subunit [Pontibacterium sp.]|uniref:efflux RND transporter periplasmic adaptor subunit n=1 Tax=Pontibacterium sp. TaxID=2036026 RepID=UPI003514BC79